MMISPESYYKRHIKGKDSEGILKEIKKLKREINRLKKELECYEKNFEFFIDPSPEVRLSCSQLYLQKAIEALEEIGTKYIPDKREQRGIDFNNSVKDISTIAFTLEGFFYGIHTYTANITEDEIAFTAEDFFEKTELNNIDRKTFLEAIKDINIGEWKKVYTPKEVIYDGIQWELIIEYRNGKKKLKYVGDNCFPYNFDELKKLFKIE
jgi:hypothetical protein